MKNEYDFLNDVNMDLSVYEERPLTEKERMTMKQEGKGKKINYKKAVGLGLCAAVIAGIAVSQTAWASGLWNYVIHVVALGQNRIMQMDEVGSRSESFKNVEAVYDENGEKIDFELDENGIPEFEKEVVKGYMELKDGSVVEFGGDEKGEDTSLKLTDPKGFDQYTEFDYVLPQQLPEGFRFKEAKVFKNENGEISGKYLYLTYERIADGETFMISERAQDPEISVEIGTDLPLEELTVNGNKAVLEGERNLYLETSGASVSILGKNLLSRDQLLQLAGSLA